MTRADRRRRRCMQRRNARGAASVACSTDYQPRVLNGLRVVHVGGVVAVLAFATGCPNPNTYGTARTVPKGKTQHTIAFEGLGASGKPGTPLGDKPTDWTLPTYEYRHGVGDELDLGVRFANFSALGVDLKWNFVRGAVDLAVVPSVTATIASAPHDSSVTGGLLFCNLPLVIGVHTSANSTLVLTPGVGAALAGFDVNAPSPCHDLSCVFGELFSIPFPPSPYYVPSTSFAPYARFGVGLNIRTSRTHAIQPELTAIRDLGNGGTMFTFGIGFSWGATPRTDRDVREHAWSSARALELTRAASARAMEGDCDGLADAWARVRKLDPDVHDSVFVRDAAISSCLALVKIEVERGARAEHEACVYAALRRARTITDVHERGRVLLARECGPSLPPLPQPDPEIARKAQARRHQLELTRDAAAAARSGDCDAVAKLDAESQQLDPKLHDAIFARDPTIGTCIPGFVAQSLPDKSAGTTAASDEPPAEEFIDRPRKPRFSPSTSAKTWLGLQLEALPTGTIDVTANGMKGSAGTELAFGIGGYFERRLVGSSVIIGFSPRLVTPVQIKGVAGSGPELDLRGHIAFGGEVVRTLHLHGLASIGYSWLFHAVGYTDPGTGSTTYYASTGPIAGLGARVSYTLHPRLLFVSEVSYQWGFQGSARVASPLPTDVGVADRYLTLGFGVATALD